MPGKGDGVQGPVPHISETAPEGGDSVQGEKIKSTDARSTHTLAGRCGPRTRATRTGTWRSN